MNYIFTFAEGLLAFISPCILPLLPLYLSYFGGKSAEQKKSKVAVNAFSFVIGFSITFVLLGLLAGSLGSFLMTYKKPIKIILGIIVIIFGISFMGLFKKDLFKGTVKYEMKGDFSFFSSLLFGIVFAVSFTPCLGVYLSAALLAAATTGNRLQGALLLLSFAAGLGIPFLLSALLLDKLNKAFNFIKKHYKQVKMISGGILVIMGILMAFQII
ncbi:MAG: cytochrome c biogenesis protein CcdA [Clostridia bacterium]|nr:cytochrome c biogenesis protein CcdA [Clostridia bacterium]